jgi:hypothetical protein
MKCPQGQDYQYLGHTELLGDRGFTDKITPYCKTKKEIAAKAATTAAPKRALS